MTTKCPHAWAGANIHAPVRHVEFFALVADALDSLSEPIGHRSRCPVCEEGLLTMRRDLATFTLQADDRCLLCGQRVIYDDIDRVRLERP